MKQKHLKPSEIENLKTNLQHELENEFLVKVMYMPHVEGTVNFFYRRLSDFIKYRMKQDYFQKETHYLRIVYSFYETANVMDRNLDLYRAITRLLVNFETEFNTSAFTPTEIESNEALVETNDKTITNDSLTPSVIESGPSEPISPTHEVFPQVGWKSDERGLKLLYNLCLKKDFLNILDNEVLPFNEFRTYFYGPVLPKTRINWSQGIIECWSLWHVMSFYFTDTNPDTFMQMSTFNGEKYLTESNQSSNRNKGFKKHMVYHHLKEEIGPQLSEKSWFRPNIIQIALQS